MASDDSDTPIVSPGGTAIGIDVGGSSIKGGVVDLASGELVGERESAPAPEGFGPAPVVESIVELVNRLGAEAPVGVGFPAVLRDGVLLTDPTSFEWPGWKGRNLGREISEGVGMTVAIANDADVAALAEQRFGAARGAPGKVLVLTLGTGIGSGLVSEGRLVPNIELGRLYQAGEQEVAEEQCSARIRTEQELSWEEYGGRLQRYLTYVERLVAPDLIVIGGAVSRESARFIPRLETRARLVAAGMRGNAGLVGAAVLTGTGG